MTEKVERKLAAIVFTDIAGFTALSSEDEEKAFALLDQQRQILKPIVTEFDGEWLKEIGDGLLLTFPTVSGAIQCSIKIQESVKNEPNLNLRIGIHEGEISVRNDDVFGDDVNIASRIEPFAAVGGIAISGKVQQNISSLPKYKSKYIGQPALKGVKQEVKVYALVSHGLPEPDLSKVSAKVEPKYFFTKKIILPLTGILFTLIGAIIWFIFPLLTFSTATSNNYDKKIAVLYLENQGNAEEAYYSDGLSEDIMNRLAKIDNLNVIPTFDVKKYKVKEFDLNKIDVDLSPDYVLYGQIRKNADQFRISVELVDLANRSKIWGDSYEKDTDQIFQIQEDITASVISEIDLKITDKDHSQAIAHATQNTEAYELLLKLKQDNYRISTNLEYIQNAIDKVDVILLKDSEYTDALAFKSVLKLMKYLKNKNYLNNSDEHLSALNEVIKSAEITIMYDQENIFANAVLIASLLEKVNHTQSISNKMLIARNAFNEINNYSSLYPSHYATQFLTGFYYLQKNNFPILSNPDDLVYAEKFFSSAYDQSQRYIKQELADPMLKLTFEAILWSLNNLYFRIYQFDKAKIILDESIQFFKNESNYFLIISSLRHLNIAEWQLGNYQNAIDNALLMKKYENSMEGYRGEFLYAEFDICMNYNRLGLPDISLELLTELIEKIEITYSNGDISISDYYNIMALTIQHLGFLKLQFEDYNSAINHYNSSGEYLIKLDKESPNTPWYFVSVRNIWHLAMKAYINIKLNNISEAKQIVKEIESLSDQFSYINMFEFKRYIFYYLSQVYKELNNDKDYKQYLDLAYQRYVHIYNIIENPEDKLSFKEKVVVNQMILKERESIGL